MRVDATNRLVRGKKITIEGGESRWVSFKYERLPNFCYRCGLLNHTLKYCAEGLEHSKEEGASVLQYRAWLKGDLIRRSGNEMVKYEVRNDAEGSSEKTEARTIRSSAVSDLPRKETRAGREHGSEKTTLKVSNPMQSRDGIVPHTSMSDSLRTKENLKEIVGKSEGIEASFGSQVRVQSTDQADSIVGMQWETVNLQKVDKVEVGALAPIIKLETKVGGPNLGHLAMFYDDKNGGKVDQKKQGVGCDFDGLEVEKPVGMKSFRPTLSSKKLSSECFEVKSPQLPLQEVTNTIGPPFTQLISKGGKWTRLQRVA